MPDHGSTEAGPPQSGPTQIWVVSDGTAGMRLQAVALADALRRARADWVCEEFTVALHGIIRALPRLAAWMPGLPLYAAAHATAGHTTVARSLDAVAADVPCGCSGAA